MKEVDPLFSNSFLFLEVEDRHVELTPVQAEYDTFGAEPLSNEQCTAVACNVHTRSDAI